MQVTYKSRVKVPLQKDGDKRHTFMKGTNPALTTFFTPSTVRAPPMIAMLARYTYDPPSNCVYHTRTNSRHTNSGNGGNKDTIGQDLQQAVLHCGPPRKRLLQTAHKHVVQRRRNESAIDGHGTGSRGDFSSGKRRFEIILSCSQLCGWPG